MEAEEEVKGWDSTGKSLELWESSGMYMCGGLAEDNARFVLLAGVLAAYMLAGAALFQRLEADLEIRQVGRGNFLSKKVKEND